MMLQNIFRDTYIYKCDVEEGREKGIEEERERQLQARLQVQRKILLTIVQAHFPTLIGVAKTQANQIKDVTIVEKIINGVGTAKTAEEARHHLLAWNQNQITNQKNNVGQTTKRRRRKNKDGSGGDL